MTSKYLTGLELLAKIRELAEAGTTDHKAIAIAVGFVQADGTADMEAFAAAFMDANDEFGEADSDDPMDTVSEDTEAFAQFGSAIIRPAYHGDFDLAEVGPMSYQKMHEDSLGKLPTHYRRLAGSAHGMIAINVCRSVIVSWFARLGNPAAGSIEERTAKYLAVWDEWEVANGGIEGTGGRPSALVIDENTEEGQAYYYQFLGQRVAEVLSTMTHNAQHPDAQWPLDAGFDKDYAWIHKQLTEGSDVVRNAISNSLVYLPRLSGRFIDIGENYVDRWWSNLMEGKRLKNSEARVQIDTRTDEDIFMDALNDCSIEPIFQEAERFKDLIHANIQDISENYIEGNELCLTGEEPAWLVDLFDNNNVAYIKSNQE